MGEESIALFATQGVSFFGMRGMEALVASLALMLAVGSFLYTLLRERRIEKGAAYLSLELASLEVFKYKAAHFDALHWGETGENILGKPELQLKEEADAFFYQCLNLFEAASRFRKKEVIQPEVYASWVAWFYEVLEFAYFRRQWLAEYRDNYTLDVREVFDSGVMLDWNHNDHNARRKVFYGKVADVLKCGVIENWRVPVPVIAPSAGPSVKHEGGPAAKLSFTWDSGASAEEAASFAAAAISSQASYISHSEIQCGLSMDGASWVPDLEARYLEEFSSLPADDLLIARNEDGRIVGIGIVSWELDGPNPYGVIEDMAVDPTMRGGGIGRQLLERLVARIEERGAAWAFLESGRENHRAHAFFEAHGFSEISHVFARRLGSPQG